MKIVHVEWFTGGRGSCAIVLVEGTEGDDQNDHPLQLGEPAAYIGTAAGFDSDQDIKSILDWGIFIDRARAAQIFAHFLPA